MWQCRHAGQMHGRLQLDPRMSPLQHFHDGHALIVLWLRLLKQRIAYVTQVAQRAHPGFDRITGRVNVRLENAIGIFE